MSDDELMMLFMFELKNKEIDDLFREMDSVTNLNSNPMAIRIAGYKAARLSFLAGYRIAERRQHEPNASA